MGLATLFLKACGYTEAAEWMANFSPKDLTIDKYGSEAVWSSHLPTISFAWPLYGVSFYLFTIFLIDRYNQWGRARANSLVDDARKRLDAKETGAKENLFAVIAANATYLTLGDFEKAGGATLIEGMKAKEAHTLLKATPWRRALDVMFAVHNYILSTGSAIMLVGATWCLVEDWMASDFLEIYCNQLKGEIYFWSYLFYASKYYELLDTLFLMLRGTNLQFLHVVHHCIVPFLFWIYLFVEFTGQWVQVTLNLAVHVIMYYYFAFVTLYPELRTTIWWRKYITQMQILQFFLDMGVTVPWWFIPKCRYRVDTIPNAWNYMYFGYGTGILFSILFGKIYFATKAAEAKAAAKKTAALEGKKD